MRRFKDPLVRKKFAMILGGKMLGIASHGTAAYHMEFGYGMSYTTPAGANGPWSGGGTQRESESESVTVSS